MKKLFLVHLFAAILSVEFMSKDGADYVVITKDGKELWYSVSKEDLDKNDVDGIVKKVWKQYTSQKNN